MEELEDNRSYLVTDGERVVRRNSHHLRKVNEGDAEKENLEVNRTRDENDVMDDNSSGSLEKTVIYPASSLTGTTTRSGRIVKANKCIDFDYY